MFKRVLAALFVVLLVSWPAARAVAQSAELMEAYRQGTALKKAGRYGEALPFYLKALRLGERELGPDHPITTTLINNLAGLYQAQGRYGDAEPLYKRALAIREKALGPGHPDVAASLNGLATLYYHQGRHDAAEPLYRRSLAIREKALGPDHPDVAIILNNLAALYNEQGRYDATEPLYKRSLAIWEKALGPGHPNVAASLNGLAALYQAQGRYADAEPLYKRAMAIWEKALGPGHPNVATSLNGLALLYWNQGRYGDAEPLYQRSLAIYEKALGPEHPNVATAVNNLATLYDDQGRYDEAEPLHQRSLAIWEKALGPDHPDVATSLNNLAAMYQAQGDYGDAEPLYKRALAIIEKSLGPDHPFVASSLNNLALLYVAQDRYGDAEPLYKRSLAIREKALGPGHPDVALSLDSLAALYRAEDEYTLALDHIRRASAIHRGRAARAVGRSRGGLSEQKQVRPIFVSHVRYAADVANKEPSKRTTLTAEAFEAGQLARATSVGAAVAGMGARFGAGDDALAKVVRAYQDALEEWQRLDKALTGEVGRPPDKRNPEAIIELRHQLAELDAKLKDLDEKLVRDFPEYAELATPRPLPLDDVQKLLDPNEALLTWLVADKSTFLWVVRNDRAEMKRLDLGREALAEVVAELRGGLDPIGVETLADIPVFDTTKAFELYQKLFTLAEEALEGARHVFVVPDGALQSLPLGVLVTEKPQEGFTDFAGYRQVSWLARKYALTTLPTVSSLRALRLLARAAQASKPFGGFGDPLLEGRPGESRGVKLASLFKSRGVADVNAVRTQLAPLPETADELRSLARTLGASNDDLFLGKRATEGNVKTQALDAYKVLAFATHGLVAGDLKNLAEPALVLTPPETGTEQDDGLLTASEVATLKLNADLVVLSACNTASADGAPNADALSGLAKAFFYAGSRSLLVSHWPVNSDASVRLTTTMLKEIANDNSIGRAEALRRSMLALMNNEEKPHYAHPMFWAPFVVVGEGGTYAVK